jgi:hypothetical protein
MLKWVMGQVRLKRGITEPSAVAPDARINLSPTACRARLFGELSHLLTDIKVDFSIRATALGSVMNLSLPLIVYHQADSSTWFSKRDRFGLFLNRLNLKELDQ